MAYDSRMTETPEGGLVPADSFANRLALVRAEMGWNYDQAQEATGVNSESWRTWEKRLRHCSDQVTVARQIAGATGMSVNWLAFGGLLSPAPPPPPRRRRHAPHATPKTSAYKGVTSRRRSNRLVTAGYTRRHLVTSGEIGHSPRAA